MTTQRPLSLFAFRALLLFALCALLLAVAHAQTATATLSGTIVDQNGAVVPGADVTIINTGTGLQRQATTDDEGSFTVPLLPPSTYRVRVQRTGFSPVEIPNVILNVGDQKALKVELKAGDVNATVQVTSDAPLINESPAVATTIDRQFVGNLPLNGRSFQSLILLTPGVTVATTGLNDYGQFSVNGQRASTNSFIVDGVSANIGIGSISASGASADNAALGGAYPGTSALGGTNNLVSVDALEEFKIQTSTYTAEFGRQPGGQVSLVTRAGTNDFHGSLFEYLRNDALDARDYFNKKPAPKTALRQNQFGGTLSGPVPFLHFGEGGPMIHSGKNRTFFFFSYEGQRLRLPISGTTNVLSTRLRNAAASAIRPLLNAFPLPTGPELRNGAGQPIGWSPYDFNISNPASLDATSIRIDHTVNSKVNLFGRFNESPSNITRLRGGPSGPKDISSTRTLTLGTTLVLTSKLNNELRFNYSRQLGQRQFLPATYGGAVPIDPALLTGGKVGYLSNNFFIFGGNNVLLASGDLLKNYQQQLNLVDNVSLVKGAHQLKFGIDYRRLSPTYAPQDIVGGRFSNETAVINATFSTLAITHYDTAHPRFTNFSVYGQDTWKVSPRLTLDLGLRWEFNPAPTEADGKMPPVALGITGNPPDVSHATLAPAGTPFYKTFYTAFAPRFGAAYQLRQEAGRETVLRGGFGVYYDLGSAGATNGFPLLSQRLLGAVAFPVSASQVVPLPIITPTSLPVTSVVYSNAAELKLPYTLQWNLAIEQSLGTRQVVSVSYVAAAARQLLTTQQINFPPDLFCCGAPAPNPKFSVIFYTWNGPTSDYHSLQGQYKARFTRGLQALVNYTWSHAIDEVSSDIGSSVLSRGNADFDVRHNLSGAISYNLPSPTTVSVLKHLLADWTVDGIVHAQTGQPVNVTGPFTIIDGIGLSIRPDVVPDQPFYLTDPTIPGGRRFNAAAFRNPPVNPNFSTAFQQGNFGRNVLRGLPLNQVDMALGRNFKLTEKVKLQFKGELFNIFNHPNFGDYGTSYTSPSNFGVPRSTLHNALGSSVFGTGFSSLYQLGGPRSVQLSLKIAF
ncbi:MAG TPA: TonB-dependent receptor [Pyrinomonadaceae bacterium]